MHEGHEHNVGLFVSRADSAESFDSPEQTLDHVPFLVRFFIILPWIGPVRLRRNDRLVSVCPRQAAGLVALVSLVHQQGHAFIALADGFYGLPSLGCVMALPAR